MHPVFLQVFVDDKIRQVNRVVVHARALQAEPPRSFEESVALRLCRVHDDEALARLAQLEGRALPAGSFVVAEVGGSIVAALPLSGGAPLADPFRSTAQIMPLLKLRAAQIIDAQREPRPQRRAFGWLTSRG